MVTLTIQKFCTCLELWKGCVLAGIFSMVLQLFHFQINYSINCLKYLYLYSGHKYIRFIVEYRSYVRRRKCSCILYALVSY